MLRHQLTNFPKIFAKYPKWLTNTTLKNPNNLSGLSGLLHQQKFGITTKPLGPAVTFTTPSDSPQGLRSYPDLSNYQSEGRPLTILLTWLQAPDSVVKKYVKLYTDKGFDVLTVKLTAYQLAWPWNIDPMVEHEVLPCLQSSPHDKKVFHGFCIGGVVFTRIKRQFDLHPEKYSKLLETIRCQVWDSVPCYHTFETSVAKSISPKSPIFQNIISKSLQLYKNTFPKLEPMFEEFDFDFCNKPMNIPALILYSKVDDIGTPEMNEGVVQKWRGFGLKCNKSVFENSPHVMHMKMYPEEYHQALETLLNECGIYSIRN